MPIDVSFKGDETGRTYIAASVGFDTTTYAGVAKIVVTLTGSKAQRRYQLELFQTLPVAWTATAAGLEPVTRSFVQPTGAVNAVEFPAAMDPNVLEILIANDFVFAQLLAPLGVPLAGINSPNTVFLGYMSFADAHLLTHMRIESVNTDTGGQFPVVLIGQTLPAFGEINLQARPTDAMPLARLYEKPIDVEFDAYRNPPVGGGIHITLTGKYPWNDANVSTIVVAEDEPNLTYVKGDPPVAQPFNAGGIGTIDPYVGPATPVVKYRLVVQRRSMLMYDDAIEEGKPTRLIFSVTDNDDHGIVDYAEFDVNVQDTEPVPTGLDTRLEFDDSAQQAAASGRVALILAITIICVLIVIAVIALIYVSLQLSKP